MTHKSIRNSYIIWLAIACLSLVTYANAQEQSQTDIDPIKQIRNEARDLVKDFQIEDQHLVTGAPEYPAVAAKMVARLRELKDDLDGALNGINQELSRDYSLLQSLKRIDNRDRPTRETIKIAKERLVAKAKTITGASYHPALANLIYVKSEFDQFIGQCRSVLCVNKIRADFERWSRLAKRINLDLDLEVTRLQKIPNMGKNLKALKAQNLKLAAARNQNLPVSLTDGEYADILAKEAPVPAAPQLVDVESQESDIKEDLAAKGGCGRIMVSPEGVTECYEPFVIENGQKLSIPKGIFSAKIHQDICESNNQKPLTALPGGLGWWLDQGRFNAHVNGLTIDAVACQNRNHGLFESRIKLNPTLMAGGVARIDSPTIIFKGLKAYIDMDSDRHAVCRTLGYSTAVNADQWVLSGSRADNTIRVYSSEYLERESYSDFALTTILCK